MINKKYLWSSGFLVIVVFSVIIVVVRLNNPSAQVGKENAQPQVVDIKEQESAYLPTLRGEVDKLKPILTQTKDSAYKSALASVRQQLVDLKVPVTWQDYHLSLVLKISLLEELIADSSVKGAQAKIKTTEQELLVLVNELDKKVN